MGKRYIVIITPSFFLWTGEGLVPRDRETVILMHYEIMGKLVRRDKYKMSGI